MESLTNGHRESLVGDVLEQYRDHLPRRKGRGRKFAEGCLGLSCFSWFFLAAALLQLLTVSGLQITISVLGQFNGTRLEQYVDCVVYALRDHPNVFSNFSLPDNSTFAFPRFGEDKQIYIYFFIALMLYQFVLCIYALKVQNIVEVYAFVVLNVLAMAYACLQVWQFRGFGANCETVTLVGYLALANAFVLLVFTLLFLLLSLTIYVEFGWKTYRLLDCDPAMRYYYRVYQVFMSGIKIVILFLLMFSVGQCILLLPPDNNEFGPTILIAFITLFIAFPVIYIIITYELRVGYVGIFFTGFLLIVYCVFKIYRYVSLTCPLCVMRVDLVNNQTNGLLEASGLQGIINQSELAETLQVNRVEDFANLTILASLVLIVVIGVTFVFIHHLRFYNKGLREYFDDRQPHIFINTHFLKRWYSSRLEVTDEKTTQGPKLKLTRVRRRLNDSNATRDSQLEQGDTTRTSGGKGSVRRDSSIDETYEMPKPDFGQRNAPPASVSLVF